jgi:hypothetical protein
MSAHSGSSSKSFARREIVAPAGLWERGVEASGIIPPSTRLLPPDTGSVPPRDAPAQEKRRAPKALATSPTGETGLSTSSIFAGEAR